jgi:cytochrome c-type biogenesis protein CcmF
LASIGHLAVVGGLLASLLAVVAASVGWRRGDSGLVDIGRRLVHLAFGAAAVGCVVMVIALLTHDFSILYVARNNATTTPPFYSVISLWAALEGSILFWTLLLTGWSSLALWHNRGRHRSLMPMVTVTLAVVAVFFFAVMVWPSNPFTTVTPVSAEGPGPNALLQNHPFMGLHPPLLYLGYTGLAVPFAFVVAALVSGRTDADWLGLVRRWTLVPWIFLSAGIVAGAWWSYAVLGWGGYWAWDPVENAALLPWLTATGFLHSALVAERRRTLRIWTVSLVAATFVLTILGTFLTRSGVVASVHSFTQSAIGAWFLAAVLVATAVSLGLIVWRLPELAGTGRPPSLVSRESAFLLNNVLFVGLAFTVLFGTLYPLIVQAASGDAVSVGAPWFNRVAAPLAIGLLLLLGVGPALPWGAASRDTLLRRFAIPTVLGVGAVLITRAATGVEPVVLAALGLAVFSGSVMADEFVRGTRARARARAEGPATALWRLATGNRQRYGGYIVHIGILVMAVSIAVSATAGSQISATLTAGDSVNIGGYIVTFNRLVVEPLAADPRVTESRAEVSVSGPLTRDAGPSLRDYPNSSTPIATPAVLSTAREDLYLNLLAYDRSTETVTLHLLVNPLVSWIWVGGGIVAAGGIFAAWPVRRRTAPDLVPDPLEAN